MIMSEFKDPYYGRPEISNSDLSELKRFWEPEVLRHDKEAAYRFGTLIDCMITEPEKINFFKFTCAGNQYTRDEFERAEEMKKAFYRVPFCKLLAQHSEFQKVSIRHGFMITFGGVRFRLNVRCKWDLFAMPKLGLSGDIKSTTAETQKQFEEACHYFEYFRQRAWYMDIEDVNNDMLIGISKKNYRVFQVPITRGDARYREGRAQYEDLSFKYAYMFGHLAA